MLFVLKDGQVRKFGQAQNADGVGCTYPVCFIKTQLLSVSSSLYHDDHGAVCGLSGQG